MQLENLRGFLIDIAKSVPYYRDLFAEISFAPENLQSLSELASLPLLTKPLIRQNVERLKARDAGKLIRYNTGGSSGEPLVFYMRQTPWRSRPLRIPLSAAVCTFT